MSKTKNKPLSPEKARRRGKWKDDLAPPPREEEISGQEAKKKYTEEILKEENSLPEFVTARPMSDFAADMFDGPVLEAATALSTGKIDQAAFRARLRALAGRFDAEAVKFAEQYVKDRTAHRKAARENRPSRDTTPITERSIPEPEHRKGPKPRSNEELLAIANQPIEHLTDEQKAERRKARKLLAQRRRRYADSPPELAEE